MPVTLPSGYTTNGDYTKTANLALFNRGLAGEVVVMRGFDRQTSVHVVLRVGDHGAEPGARPVRRRADGHAARPGTVLRVQPGGAGVVPESARRQPHFLTDNFVNSIAAGDKRSSKIVKASAASATVSGLQLTFRDPITDPTMPRI